MKKYLLSLLIMPVAAFGGIFSDFESEAASDVEGEITNSKVQYIDKKNEWKIRIDGIARWNNKEFKWKLVQKGRGKEINNDLYVPRFSAKEPAYNIGNVTIESYYEDISTPDIERYFPNLYKLVQSRFANYQTTLGEAWQGNANEIKGFFFTINPNENV